MARVLLPPGEFVDIYAETGIVIGTQIVAINQTPNDVRTYSIAGQPTVFDTFVPLIFRSGDLVNEFGDLGAWAMSVAGSSIDVREFNL